MKDIKRWLPGVLISIVLIAIILYFVDLRAMWEAVRKANFRFLGVAMALSFVWMAVRAKVWQTLLRDKPKYVDVLYTEGEGYLLNNILPFRLGELGRAFLLSRKSGIPFSEILPTIVIERTVDLAVTAVVFLAALPFVTGAAGAERVGYIVGAVVIVGLIVMFILSRNNQWALDLFHKLSARWPALQKFGGSFLESFFAGLAAMTNGWLFARFMFWMLLNWAIALLNYYLMVLAYFPQATPVWAMFGIGAAAFGGAIPSAPGAVGTFEGAIAGALYLLSGDQATALAVALTSRVYNYLNSGVIGGIGLMREGETLSGIYKELMSFRNRNE